MLLFKLLIFIGSLAYTSCSLRVCEATCNDGGCESMENEGLLKGCFCPIPDSSRPGKVCESYRDACTNEIVRYPPCKTDGKCVSFLGFPYCDCPTDKDKTQCDGFDHSKYSRPI